MSGGVRALMGIESSDEEKLTEYVEELHEIVGEALRKWGQIKVNMEIEGSPETLYVFKKVGLWHVLTEAEYLQASACTGTAN